MFRRVCIYNAFSRSSGIQMDMGGWIPLSGCLEHVAVDTGMPSSLCASLRFFQAIPYSTLRAITLSSTILVPVGAA